MSADIDLLDLIDKSDGVWEGSIDDLADVLKVDRQTVINTLSRVRRLDLIQTDRELHYQIRRK